jgi:hypothetical protein
MTANIYFSIKLLIPGGAPNFMSYQQQHSEVFLSANGKLCGPDKMAYLDSLELATEVVGAYMPRFNKRYGKDVKVDIIQCSYTGQAKSTLNRIKKDSDLLRKRLETGILASNQTP